MHDCKTPSTPVECLLVVNRSTWLDWCSKRALGSITGENGIGWRTRGRSPWPERRIGAWNAPFSGIGAPSGSGPNSYQSLQILIVAKIPAPTWGIEDITNCFSPSPQPSPSRERGDRPVFRCPVISDMASANIYATVDIPAGPIGMYYAPPRVQRLLQLLVLCPTNYRSFARS